MILPLAQDPASRGKVVDYGHAIEVQGGVRIEAGGNLPGGLDGVHAIPRKAGREAFRRCLGETRCENAIRKALEGIAARQAFDRFGIL